MLDPDPRSIMLLTVGAHETTIASVLIKVAILFALILVNAFFSMSEIAIITLNDNKIERMANEGHKKARRIVKLISDSSRFLSTIQIGVTLAGFLTSATAAQSFAPLISAKLALHITAVLKSVIDAVISFLITILMSYFSLVLGELVPKKVGMAKAEKVSFAVVDLLLFFSKITKPFVKLLSVSTNAVVRLFGIDPNIHAEEVTEEEIKMLVDVGEEKGVIENTQAEMISNIFEIDDIDAGDVMTHRVDIVAVEIEDDFEDVLRQVLEEGYSRIPVYEEDLDNIVGVLYLKDLLKYVGKNIDEGTTLKSIMRPAYAVPESKKCGDILREMIEKQIQMLIVIDEYGGTAGLVTFEDIVESIIGNVRDEYDDEEDDISKINDSIYTVDGSADIEEINDMLGINLPTDEFDTIAGLIMDKLGKIPVDGEMDSDELFGKLKFTVLSVDGRRIEKVKLELIPQEKENIEEDD